MGEVHFHGQDTDILRTGLRVVGSDAVCVDTVDCGHFGGARAGGEGEKKGWVGGG